MVDKRVVSRYTGALNGNGEASGKSRDRVGMGVWIKSCVLAKLYLRYLFYTHENIKSELHLRSTSNSHVGHVPWVT